MLQKLKSSNILQKNASKYRYFILLFFFISLIIYLIYYSADILRLENKKDLQKQNTLGIARQIDERIFKKVTGITNSLAGTKEIIDQLLHKDNPDSSKTLIALQTTKKLFNASIVYILDNNGKTVACTPYGKENKTLTGKTYAFRPYFKKAMTGKDVVYAALGITTNRRGIYFSSPVYNKDKKLPIGVIVIKISLKGVDSLLNRSKQPVALLSPEGIVFASNRSDWLYHTISDIDKNTLARLKKSKQFSNKPLNPLPFKINEKQVILNHRIHLIEKNPIAVPGWKVITIEPLDMNYKLKPIHQILIFLMIGLIAFLTLLIVILILNILKRRRAEYHLKANQENLEIKVKERTQELNESEERYRLLVEFSPDGIAVHAEEKLLFLNKYGKSLMGMEHDHQYIDKEISQFIPPEFFEQVRNRLQRAANEPNKPLLPEEQKFIRLDGEVIETELTTTFFIYKSNPAFLTIFRDITARKQVERLREDTERIVKHDLKNPLNGILGYSQLLMDESMPKVIRGYGVSIFESGTQILHMINNSLDLFKMEENSYVLKSKKFNLIRMFKELNNEFTPLQNKKSFILIYKMNNELITFNEDYLVAGEQIHLKSLFANLIKNAIEASHEDDKITISINNYNEHYEIVIHNNGIIPEDIREIFFTRYTTYGKKDGTGIGTYSAYLIAKAHGGDIKFTTSKEEGTHLIVSLPKLTPAID